MKALYEYLDQKDMNGLTLALEEGASPNQSLDDDNITPLHIAAQKDDIEAAQLLLAAGADPLLKERGGKTAIDIALECGNEKMAALILEAVV